MVTVPVWTQISTGIRSGLLEPPKPSFCIALPWENREPPGQSSHEKVPCGSPSLPPWPRVGSWVTSLFKDALPLPVPTWTWIPPVPRHLARAPPDPVVGARLMPHWRCDEAEVTYKAETRLHVAPWTAAALCAVGIEVRVSQGWAACITWSNRGEAPAMQDSY